jgi:hypothetical protein
VYRDSSRTRTARESIAHGDKWLTVIFRDFFLDPAVARAYAADSI